MDIDASIMMKVIDTFMIDIYIYAAMAKPGAVETSVLQ